MIALRSRAWKEFKPYLPLLAVVVVSGLLRVTFGAVGGSGGLLIPSGPRGGARVLLMLATLGARDLALFGVPFVATYQLVMRVARRWIEPQR